MRDDVSGRRQGEVAIFELHRRAARRHIATAIAWTFDRVGGELPTAGAAHRRGERRIDHALFLGAQAIETGEIAAEHRPRQQL